MALAGISVGGSDWLGLGKISEGIGNSASSKSVDGCGKRPMFGKKRKESFQTCVNNQQNLYALDINSQAELSAMDAQLAAELSAKNTKYIVIGLVVVALIVAMLLIKKKKK